MVKASLRQLIVLCTLHSTHEEVVASMSNLKFRGDKVLRSYMKHDVDNGIP